MDPVTKELTTDPKTRALELVLAKETESSSAGSSQSTAAWDNTLNRALNVMKNKDKLSKPSSAGRVAGKGLSTKWSEYYTAGRKERKTSSESQDRDVQELKAQVARLLEIVEEQVRERRNYGIKSVGERDAGLELRGPQARSRRL